MNEHTGKQLDILNHDLQQIQEEMMGKARAIETRLGIIKMLEECEVNGHLLELLEQPTHDLFEIKDPLQLRCTKCGCYSKVGGDGKAIAMNEFYLEDNQFYMVINGTRISIGEFINGREEE